MKQHNYTPQQIDWLREHRQSLKTSELANLFNATFNTNINVLAIRATCHRYHILSLNDGRFVANLTPWNKGITGLRYSVATEFKKGNTPHNHVPIGTETFKYNDYLWVKIAEPNKWKQKHKLIWESVHGPQPPNTIIIFLDGDCKNLVPDNLHLLTRRELLQLNRNRYSQAHTEIKPAVLALSKLQSAIFATQTSIENRQTP